MLCRARPYPRSSNSLPAAIRAVSDFAFNAKRANSLITSGAWCRASSCSSLRTFGRPPGLPLWPGLWLVDNELNGLIDQTRWAAALRKEQRNKAKLQAAARKLNLGPK